MKLKRNADLIATAALAGGGALVIEHAPYAHVRLAFALLLLFVLPGYGITKALFAERRQSLSHLCLLSIGLSLSVSILTALVLSLATNGLQTGSWLTVIVATVLGACWVAFRRRQSLEPESRSRTAPHRKSARVRARDVMLLVIASVIIVGAVAFARTPLPAKNVQGYTALSIIQGSAASPPTVRVSIASEELQAQLYRIELRTETKVTYVNRIGLVPGQKWSATVRVPSPPPGQQSLVEAALYRNNQPDTRYRSVHVWVSSGGARP